MHVHTNPINPNPQLDALYAAEMAAAKRAAESTRKKLLEFASELAGDSEEACVVRLGAREEAEEETQRQNSPNPSPKKPKQPEDAKDADSSISDWA